MSLITDLQAAIGADAVRLGQEVQEILDLLHSIRQQLADAIANGADATVLQGIHDQLQASIAALDAETPAPQPAP